MRTHNVDGAPEAIGPYSHAVSIGKLIFCSGQTPLNPETMQLEGTEIQEQTRRVLKNIAIVLQGMGMTPDAVVKTTVYLKDMDDFQGMNKVYASFFGEHKPARTTIAVNKLPLDALVEIECVAVKSD